MKVFGCLFWSNEYVLELEISAEVSVLVVKHGEVAGLWHSR